MSDMGFLVDTLAHLSEKTRLIPSFRWAVITSREPLRVRFDGGPDEPAVPVSALFGADDVGDRVLVITVSRRLYALNPRTKASAGVPPGAIMTFAGASAPEGWLACDGRQLRIADYPKLFHAIGRTYGGGGDYFALPNLRGRVPVGHDPVNTDFNHLGKVGGAATHTLTIAEMPSHTHPLTKKPAGPAKWDSTPAQVGGTDYSQTFWTGSHVGATGGNKAHNNLQPYITVNFVIKT